MDILESEFASRNASSKANRLKRTTHASGSWRKACRKPEARKVFQQKRRSAGSRRTAGRMPSDLEANYKPQTQPDEKLSTRVLYPLLSGES